MQTQLSATSTVDVQINGSQFSVFTLSGKESLFSLFYFEIIIVLDAKQFSGSWLSLPIQLRLPERYVAGVVTQEIISSFDDDFLQLQLLIEPRIALLERQARANIFLNKNVVDIVQQYLLDIGYRASQIHITCRNNFPAQTYYFQPPQETDYAFIRRIAANAGIFFWSDVDSNYNEIIRIADHNAFAQLSSVIAYTAPSNLPAADSAQGFNDLAVKVKSVAEYFSVRDYNENIPEQIVDAALGNASSLFKQQIFGMGCKDNAEAMQLSKIYYQSQQLFLEQIEGEGTRSELAPGKIFTLDATLWCGSSKYNHAYYVVEILHFAEQPSAPKGFGQDVTYHNQVTFVDAKLPFCWQPVATPLLPNLFVGHIESESQYSQLDDSGKYTNRLQLDRSNYSYTQAMPTLRRLTPYGSAPGIDGNSSVHFPLHDRAEILVSHLYGDPDRPVIVGSLYNAEQLSPVTSDNYQQHILRTAAQNELLMDDALASTVVQLQNPQGVNALRMDATAGSQQLLLNTQGQLNYLAGNNISYTVGNDCIETIGNDFIQTAAQSYSCCTMQNDLQFILRETQALIAASGIFFTAQQNINIQSARQLSLQSQQIFQVIANGEMLQILASGDGNLRSAKDLHIIGSGKGSITISQGSSSIEITHEGVVNFNAPKVVVTGQPMFSVPPG